MTEPDRTPLELREDMRRWTASPEQIRAAQDAIAAAVEQHPDVPAREWLAAVALAMPGKTYGFWQYGQPVEVVDGVWVGRNTTQDVEQSYGDARNEAAAAGVAALAGRPGTVAWVTIGADGEPFVFEDFARI